MKPRSSYWARRLTPTIEMLESRQLFAGSGSLGTTVPGDLIVTNTQDAGTGSLRQAIIEANANADANTIVFNIPLATEYLIQPATALPELTTRMAIDGTTQPGFAGTPVIELVGISAGAVTHGLVVRGGNTTVRGLVIRDFAQSGIQLRDNDFNTVVGNYIGVDRAGADDHGNNNGGVFIFGGSDGNLIGGTSIADRNVISGNGNGVVLSGTQTGGTANNVVQGNYIGTNAAGTAAIGNGSNGVFINSSPSNVIGGTARGAGNVIAASLNDSGIFIQLAASASNIVQGNRIGTGVGGQALGNARYGIVVSGGVDNLIGGNAGGAAANRIAFNGQEGVRVGSGQGNDIVGNAIYSNGALGINLFPDGVTPNDLKDLDTGANGLQNFPVITSVVATGPTAVSISGSVNTKPSTNVDLHFYLSDAADPSGNGEGQRLLRVLSLTTDVNGNANFNFVGSTLTASGAFVSATATTNDGTSEFSLPRALPLAPTGFFASDSFELAPNLHMQFSEDVSASLTVNDLGLQNLTTGQSINPSDMHLNYDHETNVAVFSFPGFTRGLLPDGRYRATILSGTVSDTDGNPLDGDTNGTAGGNLTFEFYFVLGDADHNGVVDFDDYSRIDNGFNNDSSGFSNGDFDYNGVIDFDDYSIIDQAFNTQGPALRPALPRLGGKPFWR